MDSGSLSLKKGIKETELLEINKKYNFK